MNTASLTPSQRRDVERARKLAAADAVTLDAIIERAGRQVHGPDPYPEAFGLARNYLGYLLDIIDSLTGGAS